MATDRRVLLLRHVVFLNVAAIFSLRTATDVARLGWGALPLMVAAFAVFAVPLTIAVVSLAARHPDEGGLYRWTYRAFGPGHGFLCGWCYFVTNLVYFPAVLAHVAAVLPWMLFGRQAAFAAQPGYVVAVGLIGLWGIGVLPNVLGARRTGQLSAAGVVGALAATALLALLAIVAVVRLGSAATPRAGWLPPSGSGGAIATFAMLSSLPFMFGGLELAPAMGGEIKDASRTLVRGALIAGAIVTLLFFVAITAILLGLRADEIGLADGIPAAVGALGARLGIPPIAPRAIAAFLIVAAFGSVVVWMAGSAYLLRAAGVDRAMPAWFTREHPRFGTPVGGLLAQGIVASLLMIASVAGSSVSEAYAVLRSVTQLLYYVPFLYLFAAHIRLSPAGRRPLWLAGAIGFATTAAGLLAAALPPSEVSSIARFELKVLGGSALLALAGLPFYLTARRGTGPTPAG